MGKITEEMATEELNCVLEDWADGSALPFSDETFKTMYNSVLQKLICGRIYVDKENKTIQMDDYVFKVPLGEVLLGMGDQNMAGVMNMAALMCGKDRGHFANVDARKAKTAAMIASLFTQV